MLTRTHATEVLGPLLAAAFLALAGCASRPPLPPASLLDASADASADPRPKRALLDAQERYFKGVRAYVREDFETAREAILACLEELDELTPVEGEDASPTAREAESLRTKSDYFLKKIEERTLELASRETLEETNPASREVLPRVWQVEHGAIAAKVNPDVERWMKYFLGDGRELFQKWLDRKARVQPIYEEAFARHGMPPELVYHSMIESGFSTSAYSWAHAVGLWQFIRATARLYGLRVDWWVDERRDPEKSTEAAVRYLRDLYVEFQDWELALAAYNVGEAKIRRQIHRQKTRDFWKLRLPRETRNHVPKFYAALIIGSDPEKYGFTVTDESPVEAETILVDFCASFETLGKCCGVPAEQIAALNPALVRHCTPPDEKGFQVLVPPGTAERATDALASIPPDDRVRWASHRVRRGETLSQIAKNYGTSVQAIMEANRLRDARHLSIGRELVVPEGRARGASPPQLASAPETKSVSNGTGNGNRTVYVVKQGDTLSEIAERHGTSPRQLRRWNRIGRFIYPGQRLSIYSSGSAASASRARASGDYTVKVARGDTLWRIAKAHGVSLMSLLRANNLKRAEVIKPGDLIRVPRS